MKCVEGSATKGLHTSKIMLTLRTDEAVVRKTSRMQDVSVSDIDHTLVVNFISGFCSGAPSESSNNSIKQAQCINFCICITF